MTHPGPTSESPLAHQTSDAGTVARACIENSPPEQPTGTSGTVSPIPGDTGLVDQSGRTLGPRALRTRARILEATVVLLDEKSMRDLRVIDIARRIGSSPATFYQYFKDVRDVVLELATEVSNSVPDLVELIDGDWIAANGHDRGRRLSIAVLDYWERYASILRVRNNAAEEGDEAFAAVRFQAIMPMITAFTKVLDSSRESQSADQSDDGEWHGGRLYPISASMMLFSTLEGMAVHRARFEARFKPMGEGREELIETMATMIQSILNFDRNR